ncbi:MAG: hypothetical protein EBU84_05295, partial [Actinobacteria bacterium]|nr:hypothetical protein [Actinomycetota bacterium]
QLTEFPSGWYLQWVGGAMTDWQAVGIEVQIDTAGLVKPPVSLLAATLSVALISASSALFSSAIGYVVAVCASILGGVTALQDQKRRGHPSYVTLNWFSPSLRIIRYLILLITLIHVARLAIAAAEGSGLFW